MKNHIFNNASTNPNLPSVKDITPEDLLKAIDHVKVVDVRRLEEWEGELGHIQQAELITLDTLPAKVGDLPQEQTIVFVCRSGGRSAQAAQFAQSQGISNVYNMQGGMLAWNKANLPLVTRNGN